jgi:hypothetical protein
LGNWATEWQTSHTEGEDWYSCSSAHSQPLNANQKAYAAWWLWARLAGWEDPFTNDTDGDGEFTIDSDEDGDVDGKDLSQFPLVYDEDRLASFASAYGN